MTVIERESHISEYRVHCLHGWLASRWLLSVLLFIMVLVVLPVSALQTPTQSSRDTRREGGSAQGNGPENKICPPLPGTKSLPMWVEIAQAVPPEPSTPPENGKTETHPSTKRSEDPNWWLACLTGGLVLIGSGQAFLFYWQLSLLRKSLADNKTAAEAARDSAQAAGKSAAIATNSERAWIVTEAQFSTNFPDLAGDGAPEQSLVLITVVNAGRTPAEIERMLVCSFLYPSDFKFPDDPIYEGIEDIMHIQNIEGEIFTAGKDRHILSPLQHIKVLTDEQMEDIRTGRTILYCYGQILYKDISGSIRTTQFGYYYFARSKKTDRMLPGMYRLRRRAYNYTN